MHPRRTCLALLAAGACTSSSPTDEAPEVPSAVAGSITRDQVWRDSVTLLDDAVIEPGVTVTIEAGTELLAQDGKTLTVAGSLIAAGTAAAPVVMLPSEDGMVWAGIVVEEGGALSMSHVTGTDVATLAYCKAGAITCELSHLDFAHIGNALVTEARAVLDRSRVIDTANGGVSVRGGDLTITHSYLVTSTHDLVVQVGGRMVIEYSEIGEANGSYEHCNIHVGAADYLSITHSTIRSGVYGMMIGGTNGAIIQYNNFVENDPGKDISEVGENVAVDMRFNYWDQGAPALGTAFDTSAPAAGPIGDAHPRQF